MKCIKLFLNCISRNITNKNELKFKNYNNIIIIYHAVSSSSLRKKKKEKKKNKIHFSLHSRYFLHENVSNY